MRLAIFFGLLLIGPVMILCFVEDTIEFMKGALGWW